MGQPIVLNTSNNQMVSRVLLEFYVLKTQMDRQPSRIRAGEVLTLAVRAFAHFIMRLWFSAMICCTIITLVKSNRSSFQIPDVRQLVRIQVLNGAEPGKQLYALSELTGGAPQPTTKIAPVYAFSNTTACYSITLPEDLKSVSKRNSLRSRKFGRLRIAGQLPAARNVWFAMVPNGGCSLEIKGENAQRAGFGGLIVHDVTKPRTYHSSARGRVSARSDVDDSSIPVLLMSYVDAQWIYNFTGEPLKMFPRTYPIIRLSRLTVPVHQLILKLGFEMVIMFVALVISATLVLSLCLSGLLIYNFAKHRELFFWETVLHGSLILLDAHTPNYAIPKLSTIPFPETTLTEEDTLFSRCENNNRHTAGHWNDACSICLDEFEVGHRVRVLPCRHMFHSTW